MHIFDTITKPVAKISLVAFIITASIAHSANSQSNSVRDQLYQAYTAEGTYDQKAIKIKSIYEKALTSKKEEDIAQCQLYLARCYFQLKKFDKAAPLLELAGEKFALLKQFDLAGACNRDLVEVKIELSQYAEAIDTAKLAYEYYFKARDLLSAAKMKESESDINFLIGLRYSSAVSLKEAVEILKGKEHLEYRCKLSWKLGETFRILHQYDDAIEQFSIVFSAGEALSESHQAQFYSSLGKTYLEVGKIDNSIQHFETAAFLDPDNLVCLGHLAHCQSKVKATQKSKDLRVRIRKVVDDPISTVNAEVYLACGNSLVTEGDSIGATYWFERGLQTAVNQVDPDIGVICFKELIRIYAESGDKDKISRTVLLAKSILSGAYPEAYLPLRQTSTLLEQSEYKKALAIADLLLEDISWTLQLSKLRIHLPLLLSQLAETGQSSENLDLWREAADIYRVSELHLMSIQSHFMAAEQLRRAGKYLESNWRIEEALNIMKHPGFEISANSGTWICSQLYESGKLDAAENCARQVINLDNLEVEEEALIRIQLFRIYYRQNEFERAIAALPINPPAGQKIDVAARKVVALMALNKLEEALNIGIAALPDEPKTYADAELLADIGVVYSNMKKYEEALKFYKWSEEVSLQQDDLSAMGLVANFSNLASTYGELGDENEMFRSYMKGYAISKLVDSPFETKILLGNFAASLFNRGDFTNGVFFMKECLMIPNSLSSGNTKQVRYADLSLALANGLFMSRRFDEAYTALASSNPNMAVNSHFLDKTFRFTVPEIRYQEIWRVLLEPYLERVNKFNTFSGNLEEPLSSDLVQLFADVDKFTDTIKLEPTQTASSDIISGKLDKVSKKCNRPVVFLRSVVYGNRVLSELQLVSHTIQEEKVVNETALKNEVALLSESLSRGTETFKASASMLYDSLIRPLEKHIPENAIILWWPVDSLRTIPLGALFDGKQFLVQKWASCNVPTYDAELDSISLNDDAPTHVSIFAASLGGPGYSQLPGARAEAANISKLNGIGNINVKGQPLVDGAFTSRALYDHLIDDKINVIHLATHFKPSPDAPWSGELLLGNGKTLSTSQIVAWANQSAMLDHLKLIVLSACETQLTGAVSQQGADYDSLGDLFIALGVDSTVTTLWKINDASSAGFMEGFYRSYGQQGIGKAIALQQVQKSIIQGTSSIPNWAIPKARGDNEDEVTQTTSKDIRHPHYWAPFILSGSPN